MKKAKVWRLDQFEGQREQAKAASAYLVNFSKMINARESRLESRSHKPHHLLSPCGSGFPAAILKQILLNMKK